MSDLDTTHWYKRAYCFIFVIRRAFFAIFFVYLDSAGEKMLIVLMYMNLAIMIGMAQSKPMRSQSMNRRLLFSEALILMVSDCMVMFTSNCRSEHARYSIGGWLYIGIIFSFIGFSLVLIIFKIFKLIFFFSKKLCMDCRDKQKEEEEYESSNDFSSSSSSVSSKEEEKKDTNDKNEESSGIGTIF